MVSMSIFSKASGHLSSHQNSRHTASFQTPHHVIGKKLSISIFLCAILVSLLLRLLFVHHYSFDYLAFLQGWFNYIQYRGGFQAFDHVFADYNVPYLYMLTIGSYLHIDAIWTVKIIGALFDALGALYIYKIVSLLQPRRHCALIAAGIYTILPSVVMISALWGQADGIYTSIILAAIYYYMIDASWKGSVCIGIAFSIKLQTIFIFPALALWVLVRKVSWQSLIVIPTVFFAFFIPVISVGGSLKDFATVYVDQSADNHYLTESAPNLGALFIRISDIFSTLTLNCGHSNPTQDLLWKILLLAGIVGAIVFLIIGTKKLRPLTPPKVLLTGTISALLCPWLLPSMHERYFFTATVLLYVCAWTMKLPMVIAFFLSEIVDSVLYFNFVRHSININSSKYHNWFTTNTPNLGTRSNTFGQHHSWSTDSWCITMNYSLDMLILSSMTLVSLIITIWYTFSENAQESRSREKLSLQSRSSLP